MRVVFVLGCHHAVPDHTTVINAADFGKVLARQYCVLINHHAVAINTVLLLQVRVRRLEHGVVTFSRARDEAKCGQVVRAERMCCKIFFTALISQVENRLGIHFVQFVHETLHKATLGLVHLNKIILRVIFEYSMI